MGCGCRELGCVGCASVCLSVHLCQGARSVGGLCSLWVCTLDLGGVGGDGRGEQVGGSLPGGARWLPGGGAVAQPQMGPGGGAGGRRARPCSGRGPRCRALSLPQPSSTPLPARWRTSADSRALWKGLHPPSLPGALTTSCDPRSKPLNLRDEPVSPGDLPSRSRTALYRWGRAVGDRGTQKSTSHPAGLSPKTASTRKTWQLLLQVPAPLKAGSFPRFPLPWHLGTSRRCQRACLFRGRPLS